MNSLRPLLCLSLLAGLALAADPAPPAAPTTASAESARIRAKLSPVRYAVISAEVGAKVDRLPFAEGARFRVGDPLVVFEASVYRAQAEKARVQFETSQRVVEAYRRLAQQGSVGQLELVTAEAKAAEAKADLQLAQVMLAKCTILAPFSGRVGEWRIREQQYAQSGQPVIEVIDDSVLELEFIAPSSSFGSMRVGQSLLVSIDETGKDYEATIVRIGAKIDPVSQTIKIAASLKSNGPTLLAGMTGTISLPRK